MICVDCDQTITGPSVLVGPGESMSGARSPAYAHPPRSPQCRPKVPAKRLLRQAMNSKASEMNLKS
jgi:hypothetical protein